MPMDFYGEYKEYSNAELLMIVRQPDEYQPEAVAAAAKILEQREVTEEESRWVDSSLQDLAFARQYESEKFGRMKAKTAELFPPVFQPHEKIEPSKWLNFLLLLIGIEYVWMLYGAAKELFHIFSRRYGQIWWGDFIGIVPVVYTPVIFYLLFKRRRWGWMLLFADNLGMLILLLGESLYFFKYVAPHGITSYFSWILLRAVFAVFLWREMIAGLFSVDMTTKKRTLMITIVMV